MQLVITVASTDKCVDLLRASCSDVSYRRVTFFHGSLFRIGFLYVSFLRSSCLRIGLNVYIMTSRPAACREQLAAISLHSSILGELTKAVNDR